MRMFGLYCPACGAQQLNAGNGGTSFTCMNRETCPDRYAAAKVLADPETEHVVRFDAAGYFNAKHPLRERIGDALLDCAIHDAVVDHVHDLPRADFADTVWRVRRAGEHNLDANWVWEPIT